MNKNVLKDTNSKILLIGKIKGLAEESKKTRKLLLKNRGETYTKYFEYSNGEKFEYQVNAVDKFAYTKNVIGADIRHHLLAYAFMRGEAYHKLEKKCRPGGQPNAETILQIAHAHLTIPSAKGWLLENIQAWLKGDE